MPKDSRQFVNPLTRPSTPQGAQEATPTTPIPAAAAIPTSAIPEAPPATRARRKADSFERRNERTTLWMDKRLKQQFESLAYREGVSKTALLNEAIADLLKKHER